MEERSNLHDTGDVWQDQAAQLAHEANRVYCESIGDTSQVSWTDAPNWQRDSARNGVRFIWDGTRTAEQSHENWLEEKRNAGWSYGPVKDVENKRHPAFLPYKDLPPEQKIKDTIFRSVVLGFKRAAGL